MGPFDDELSEERIVNGQELESKSQHTFSTTSLTCSPPHSIEPYDAPPSPLVLSKESSASFGLRQSWVSMNSNTSFGSSTIGSWRSSWLPGNSSQSVLLAIVPKTVNGACVINLTLVPHVLDSIVDQSDYSTLLVLRQSCKFLKLCVDRVLRRHVVIYRPAPRTSRGVSFVIKSERGPIPGFSATYGSMYMSSRLGKALNMPLSALTVIRRVVRRIGTSKRDIVFARRVLSQSRQVDIIGAVPSAVLRQLKPSKQLSPHRPSYSSLSVVRLVHGPDMGAFPTHNPWTPSELRVVIDLEIKGFFRTLISSHCWTRQPELKTGSDTAHPQVETLVFEISCTMERLRKVFATVVDVGSGEGLDEETPTDEELAAFGKRPSLSGVKKIVYVWSTQPTHEPAPAVCASTISRPSHWRRRNLRFGRDLMWASGFVTPSSQTDDAHSTHSTHLTDKETTVHPIPQLWFEYMASISFLLGGPIPSVEEHAVILALDRDTLGDNSVGTDNPFHDDAQCSSISSKGYAEKMENAIGECWGERFGIFGIGRVPEISLVVDGVAITKSGR